MKSIKKLVKTFAATILLTTAFTAPAFAQNALVHSGQASANSARAVGHGLAAIGKTAVTVVAVPFKAVGAIGGLSDKTGDALLEAGTAPLEIGDDYATAGPSPDAALAGGSEQ